MFHDAISHISYMPHGYCLLWQPWLVALHAGSDVLIFFAYSAIPLAMWIFLRRRRDLELRTLALLFCAFIFLCGLTHLLQAITLWLPIYEVQGVVKFLTALVSVGTAGMIFPLIPKALAIPSPAQLKKVNDGLEREINSHRETLKELELAKGQLEARVAERTSELAEAKARFETLIQASAEVVWTANSHGEMSVDSPSWRLFTGQTYDQFKGMGWLDAVHPDERDSVVGSWKSAIAARKPFRAEYRIQHIGGDWRWTVARAAPLQAAEGAAPEWVGMNTDITERKDAESAIRLQADQYAAILSATTDGFMLLDRHARLLDVNDAYCRMSGYSRDELLGSSMSKLEAFRSPAELSEHMEQIIFEGYDHFEIQHRKKNKQILYIECSAVYWTATGQLICFLRDITQRKRAEQALRESEESLREAQQIAEIGSWDWDLSASVLRWSEAGEKILGRDPASRPITLDEFLAYAHPEDRPKLETSMRVLRETGQPSFLEYRIIRADGELRCVEARGRRYEDAEGSPVRLAGTVHDITERKHIEERLEASALYIRSLFEASLDLLITIDTGGRIIDVNRASELVFGCSRGALIGRDFASIFTDPDRARAGVAEVLSKGFASDLPLDIRHASGKLTQLMCNASVFRSPDGTIQGVFAAGRDVSQLKQVQSELRRHQEHLEELVASRTEELAKANDKLKLANAEMESFAYSVSHDLRVPLRAIDGFSRALLEDYSEKLDSDGSRLLNVVHDNTVKMGRLIDDILAFSRVGRVEMAHRPVDMNALVRSALTDLEPITRQRDVEFRVADLPPALGDGATLQRVWTNLIENAVKYSGQTPNAVVEIGAIPGPGETTYFVKDNGAGFDMQYVDRLFGVFQRLHSSEFPGTGIGLAIVKRIVTRHGGRVWAEGKVNEGASFSFTLPAAGADHE